jgi:hypothetical protein
MQARRGQMFLATHVLSEGICVVRRHLEEVSFGRVRRTNGK